MAQNSKSSQLQIRVSAAQKLAIQRNAQRARMDMTTYVLSRVLPEPAVRFQTLAAACETAPEAAFAFAALNKFLSALLAAELREAVSAMPREISTPFVANYVAAMVEQACAQQGLLPPAWTRSIEPLPAPYFGSCLQGLRLYLLTHSPPPFRRRNIFIDSGVGVQV